MAATELFGNTLTTTVSSGGTTAPSSGTTETWTVAANSGWPAAVTGLTQFHVADLAAPSELIAVTNVSGATWTVTRGAESTTPVAHVAGFTVYQVIAAGWATSVELHKLGWLNAVKGYYADPTGATDSTTAIQNALNAAVSGQVVYLPAGTYQVSAPLVLPAISGITLAGDTGAMQGGAGSPGVGTIIKPSAAFASTFTTNGGATPISAVIIGGAGVRANIQDLWIYGVNLPGGTACDGINFYSSAGGHSLYRVGINNMTGWGVYIKNVSGSGGTPLGFYSDTLIIQNCGAGPLAGELVNSVGGGYFCGGTDCTHHNVHAQNNVGIQIAIGSGDNRLVSCRADGDNVAGSNIGYYLATFNGSGALGLGVIMVGCSTGANDQQAVYCSGGGHSAYGPYQIIGCSFNGDGKNGGSGGLAAIQCIGRVDVTIIGTNIATDATGTWPAYALSTAQNSGSHAVPDIVQASGGLWQAGTAFINDAGPATKLVIDPKVYGFTGAQNGTSGTTAFTPVRAPAAPAGFFVSAPTGTTAGTGAGNAVMMGLGSTFTYTPASSGTVLVNLTLMYLTQTATANAIIIPKYGTGAAPSNQGSLTGTTWGTTGSFQPHTVNTANPNPFAVTSLLSLTAGTAYWFDVALATSNISDEAVISSVNITLLETS